MTIMNAQERDRFLATLRRDADFRADVRRELLTEELLNLPQTVAVLVDTAAQQRQDFTALAHDVADYMERTISALREGFAVVGAGLGTINTELGNVHTGLGTIRTELGIIHMELGTLGTGQDNLRTELDSLRTELDSLRGQMDAGFTSIKAKFDQVDADLRDIRDQLAS